jgi:hypothetical protein
MMRANSILHNFTALSPHCGCSMPPLIAASSVLKWSIQRAALL